MVSGVVWIATVTETEAVKVGAVLSVAFNVMV
jgi:hypothetical protein